MARVDGGTLSGMKLTTKLAALLWVGCACAADEPEVDEELAGDVTAAFTTGTTEPTAANTGLNVNGLTTADLTVTSTSSNGDLLVNDAWVASHGTTQTINGVATKVIDKIWVKGFLTFTAKTPVLFTNSQFEGRRFTGAAPIDAVIHARSTSTPIGARVSFQNCKITVVQPDVGLTTAAGERLGDMIRCDLSRGSDGLDYWNPAAGQRVWGSYFHDFSFWAHDPKHTTDPTNPGWSHNDYIQSSGGDGLDIFGNAFEVHAAVGVGDVATLTASGFPNRNWGSAVALTAGSGHITNAQVRSNWFRGGQVHVFLPTQNTGIDFGDSMTVHHNRHDFGLHGYGPFSGSFSKQFIRWGFPMGPAVTDMHDNVLLSEANVPANLRGTLLPSAVLIGGRTSTGQYIVALNSPTQ